jgi:hypothetical protein
MPQKQPMLAALLRPIFNARRAGAGAVGDAL